MTNVVDRVPTEVLSNGAVRWEQFDSQGNSLGYVYLKRADEPSVEGTPINKALFDGIQADLTDLENEKLNISDKATKVEAETGEDNTKYMTPLRVKQALLTNKVKINNIAVSTSSSNNIDLTQYINSDVVKLEIPISMQFGSSYTAIKIVGDNIDVNTGGRPVGGDDEVNISSHGYIAACNLTFSIYPVQQKIDVRGIVQYTSSSSGGTGGSERIDVNYTYDGITNLKFGEVNRSFDNPMAIIQYLK